MGTPQENEKLAVIRLNLIDEIGPVRFKNLITHFGSAHNVFSANKSEIAAVEGISALVANKVAETKNTATAEKEIESANNAGVKIIAYNEDSYPCSLKDIYDAPAVIYVRGDVSACNDLGIAVVGTRHPTAYGLSVTRVFSRDLALLGVATVSGLARGIDTEAHNSTLAAGGRTIAVLGNGLGKHYPPENRKLEDKIADFGAVVSEFSMDTDPDKCNFPRRNRLISGLSLATLVIEADEKSGALITAKYALEQGKDVFAVPGPVFSKYSKGPHLLIKQGARLTESAQDIVDEIRPLAELFKKRATIRVPAADSADEGIEGSEKKIMKLVESNFGGVSADMISAVLKLGPAEISSTLTTLEIKGYIRCLPGNMYIKNNR
jgi:DNA processing protein